MLIDNKKTREISWNDFELSGNKENLIKQGWESFEPYGFGEYIGKAPEEVFDENYAQNELLNGDFKGDMSVWNNYSVRENGYVAIGRDWGLRQFFDEKKGNYKLVAKIKSLNNNTLRPWATQYKKDGTQINSAVPSYITPEKWEIIEIELTDDEFIGIAFLSNISNEDHVMLIDWIMLVKKDEKPLKYYPNWQDLSDEEKPVNAYEKGYTYIQPLDNGFTRIRTKGGDTDMKYKSPNFGQLAETGTNMTISLYVENNSDSMIRFSNNLAIGGEPYPDGVKYMITVPREYKGFAYLKGEQVGRDVELDIRSDGNIDMIVSQPEIIEGHDLNAMLVIEDLDDGRKHVQVHNVNENTKLVYTGGGVIKGEPYTLETEIENDGRIFNLSANMFDDAVEVQKGMNDIRKSGELQDKELKIEIGVD